MTSPAITDDAVGISEAAASRTSGVVDQLLAPLVAQHVEDIELERLHEHPDNPRGTVGDVAELADSIKASGIFEPLIVASGHAWQASDDRLPMLGEGDYVVIAGHRRRVAAKTAGRKTVPCIVRDDLIGPWAEVAMLVENLQREDLTPIQEARGFARLEEQGKSQREIARLVGRNQSHVSKRLALLKLPDDVQAQVGTDELTVVDAIELAKVADDPKVLKTVMQRPNWQSIEQAAATAVKEREHDQAIAEARTRLRSQGIQKFVSYPRWGFYKGDTPTSLDHLAEDGVDVADHEHFACHAVAVGYGQADDLKIVPVCTNPKTHGDSSAAKQASAREENEQKIAREKAARERKHAARTEALKAAVNTMAGKKDISELVLRMMVESSLEYFYDNDFRELVQVLGLTTAEEDVDEPDVVRAYASKDQAALERTAAAIALLLVESAVDRGYGDELNHTELYLRILQGHGYKATAAEKQLRSKNGRR